MGPQEDSCAPEGKGDCPAWARSHRHKCADVRRKVRRKLKTTQYTVPLSPEQQTTMGTSRTRPQAQHNQRGRPGRWGGQPVSAVHPDGAGALKEACVLVVLVAL